MSPQVLVQLSAVQVSGWAHFSIASKLYYSGLTPSASSGWPSGEASWISIKGTSGGHTYKWSRLACLCVCESEVGTVQLLSLGSLPHTILHSFRKNCAYGSKQKHPPKCCNSVISDSKRAKREKSLTDSVGMQSLLRTECESAWR